MRVVWASDTLEQLNGVATYINTIAPHLQKRLNLALLTGRVQGDYPFSVRSLPNIPAPFQRDYDIIFPNFMHLNYDIIHVHTAYCLGFYSSLIKLPKVATTHLHPYHLVEGVFGYDPPKHIMKLAWKYVLSFFNRFDVVICQTDATKEMYESAGLKRKAVVIPNGFDFQEHTPCEPYFKEKFNIPGDYALFLGRLDASKRIDWVIDTAQESPNRHFVIVGDGTLKKQIPEQKNIHYLGRLDGKDKNAALRECSMLLMPSKVETEGLVAQEAMYFKKPVLIADNPVLKEVTGKGGIACKNLDDFKEKTAYLFGNPQICNEKGELSFESLKKRDITDSVEKTVRVYESLM